MFGSKLVSTAARIAHAVLLASNDYRSRTINAEHIRDAVTLCRYFIVHYRQALGLTRTGGNVADVVRIAEWFTL